MIDCERGWLACSPDDLARDYSVVEDDYGLVEYKCPYYVRDITVEEACKKKDFTAYVCEGWAGHPQTHTQILLSSTREDSNIMPKKMV